MKKKEKEKKARDEEKKEKEKKARDEEKKALKAVKDTDYDPEEGLKASKRKSGRKGKDRSSSPRKSEGRSSLPRRSPRLSKGRKPKK